MVKILCRGCKSSLYSIEVNESMWIICQGCQAQAELTSELLNQMLEAGKLPSQTRLQTPSNVKANTETG